MSGMGRMKTPCHESTSHKRNICRDIRTYDQQGHGLAGGGGSARAVQAQAAHGFHGRGRHPACNKLTTMGRELCQGAIGSFSDEEGGRGSGNLGAQQDLHGGSHAVIKKPIRLGFRGVETAWRITRYYTLSCAGQAMALQFGIVTSEGLGPGEAGC